MDDDLTKVVNLDVSVDRIDVEVRYGTDHLVQQDRRSIRLEDLPCVSYDQFGVTVKVTRRVIPWLAWPRWKLTYRF